MAAHPARIATRAMVDPDRILDSLSTSVLIVDQKLDLLYLNVAAETLFGVSRNQVRGRPLAELLVDASGLNAVVERAIETWRPFSRRELALRPVYGEGELIVDCNVAPYDEPGTPSAVLIEISDGTQHQRINSRMRSKIHSAACGALPSCLSASSPTHRCANTQR